MYGFKILCEISKGTFEISHKIFNQYTAKYAFTVFYICVWVVISLNCNVISLSETGPWPSADRSLLRFVITVTSDKPFCVSNNQQRFIQTNGIEITKVPHYCPIGRGTHRLPVALMWRHNGHDGVLNHQPHDYLPNRLFRRRSKKTSKFRVTCLCAGNSIVTGEFPA